MERGIVKTVRTKCQAAYHGRINLARRSRREANRAEAHSIRAAVDAEAQKLLRGRECAHRRARYVPVRRRLLDRSRYLRESVKPMESRRHRTCSRRVGGMAGNVVGSSRTNPTDELTNRRCATGAAPLIIRFEES